MDAAHGDARARASASEYLDNILTGAVRKMAMPIARGPAARREGSARQCHDPQTRPRDVEETLLDLINDDDQVIAAVAIDVVRQQRLWTLAADIEHVLAHRDVRDWYVFEAASWALAEQRMPAERRRELWLEPLPAAVLADRLRGLPLFASVSVDELFRIAAASEQVRHEPGTALLTEGAAPETIHSCSTARSSPAARIRLQRPSVLHPPSASCRSARMKPLSDARSGPRASGSRWR